MASSITAWQLFARLYRLSVNTYRNVILTELTTDFTGFATKTTLSSLSVNQHGFNLPDDHQCFQIQGLFIQTEDQKPSLEQRLIYEAVHVALNQNFELLLVKAHESTVSFFEHHGFHRIPVTDEVCDGPYRLVRSVM